MLRAIVVDTFMVDSDVGEMFLNFMLEERCARFAGVDITLYVKEGKVHQRESGIW
jgi:hypothetical protein